jgi:peptide/nickel transport system substrate-binding protein
LLTASAHAYTDGCHNEKRIDRVALSDANLCAIRRRGGSPMTTSRRTFVKGSVATAAIASAPGVLKAQTAPSRARTLRAVLHGDLKVFDPVWTTANMTGNHGLLIYDTLFGMDEQGNVKPQMVDKWQVSDDKKTYTFQLREGLAFHDGQAVTSDDCVASILRWSKRDGAAQHMFRRVKEVRKKDERVFEIVLKENYGLVMQALGKLETNLPVMMRKKDAETDPNQQVTNKIGSGPFVYNEAETKSGQRYVYDKNAKYKPRAEPASGIAGGKIAKVDRIVIENMADEQTAVAALKAGEIDFYEIPPIDLLDQLEGDKNIRLEVINKGGNVGMCRLNWLHPPFDNVYARQAMLHLVKQEDILRAVFGNPKYFRSCPSLFGCTGTMQSDVNTDWFKGGQNIAKAKELFKKAGYDGRPVTILQATNISFMNNASLLIAQWLKEAGVNAQLAASDWGGVVTRRAVKKPPAEGGWNIFITWGSGEGFDNPIGFVAHTANGEAGWFGWPKDDKHEALRDQWALAETTDQRKAIARQLQENAWNYVPMALLGQWAPPVAMRANVKGFIPIPAHVPFWNVEKA